MLKSEYKYKITFISMIKWTSKGKEGDPIPWPYKPFCSYSGCIKNTEYVLNPESGFKRAKTFCEIHAPTTKCNYELSKSIEDKESLDIQRVKKGTITESELLGKNYVNN